MTTIQIAPTEYRDHFIKIEDDCITVIDPDGNRILNPPIASDDVDPLESTMMWIVLGKPDRYPVLDSDYTSDWRNEDLKGVMALMVCGEDIGIPSVVLRMMPPEKLMEFWQMQDDESKATFRKHAALLAAKEQLNQLLEKLGIQRDD